MSRGQKFRWICLALSPFVCCCGFPFTPIGTELIGPGTGSSVHARIWRARFERLPDPEAAQAAYPEVVSHRCENGEWAFLIGTDSHGSWWGGTIVVKDSTGRVRAFFGHVCGPNNTPFRSKASPTSLDDFYRCTSWEEWRYSEYKY